MFDSFFFCKVPFSSGIQGRNRQIQNFYTKNFSDFPSKILDIIFLRCDNKTVERFQTSHNFINGLVAQLGAHHIRIVGVVGSNPIRSIKNTIRFPDGVFVITSVIFVPSEFSMEQKSCSLLPQVRLPVCPTSRHHGRKLRLQAQYRYSGS